MEDTDQDTRVAALRSTLLDDLLSYDQACQALGGISRYTLSRFVRDQKLVSVKVPGRGRFIDGTSLANFIGELRGDTDSATKSA